MESRRGDLVKVSALFQPAFRPLNDRIDLVGSFLQNLTHTTLNIQIVLHIRAKPKRISDSFPYHAHSCGGDEWDTVRPTRPVNIQPALYPLGGSHSETTRLVNVHPAGLGDSDTSGRRLRIRRLHRHLGNILQRAGSNIGNSAGKFNGHNDYPFSICPVSPLKSRQLGCIGGLVDVPSQ